MRAISTVLDVTLCLLLVSAAIVTLGPELQPGRQRDAPGETVTTLTTATTEVTVDRPGDRSRPSVRGTYAEHLAAAAVSNWSSGPSSIAYRDAVAAATRAAARQPAVETQVVADWTPVRDGPLGGRVGVGPMPPPSVSVHAATVTVPSGLPVLRDRAIAAARSRGYRGVASVVAESVVEGRFPPRRTRLALAAGGAASNRVRRGYRRVAETAGVRDFDAPRPRTVEAANDRLQRALVETLEPSLRRTYASPAAAARSVRVGRVRLTVRTWSP